MRVTHNIRYGFILAFLLWAGTSIAQNVTVSGTRYTPKELIEKVLINSGCIQNVDVTDYGGIGHFDQGKKSMGYFQNNGGTFPFKNGIVLTTGELNHVQGPNKDSRGVKYEDWKGDTDLEKYLGLTDTHNASTLEFDFTPKVSNTIQFRYIFASGEYHDGKSPKTCKYSDAFAFLIKKKGTQQYKNIALIPETDIPVKVTTVHRAISGGCSAQHEEYFGNYNAKGKGSINFNGQTKVLTATASVQPGTTYHIKLVIADDDNDYYDSAVFIEGGSFQASANLGSDITGACPRDTVTLQPQTTGTNPQAYQWYKVQNGTETAIAGAVNATYKTTTAGTYKVKISYGSGCKATDEIKVGFADFSQISSKLTISSCYAAQNGNYRYNLPSFENLLLGEEADKYTVSYFKPPKSAAQKNDRNQEVRVPEKYDAKPGTEVYARVTPKGSSGGCAKIVTITLKKGNDYPPVSLYTCATGNKKVHFNLEDARSIIKADSTIDYFDGWGFYRTCKDAATEAQEIKGKQVKEYEVNVKALPLSVFFRMNGRYGCKGIIEVKLKTLPHATIDTTYEPPILCQSDTSSFVVIHPGIKEKESNYTYKWDSGDTTATLTVTKPGKYTVTIAKDTVVNGQKRVCSITNTIMVQAIQKPQLSYKLLGDLGDQKVKIMAKGNGDYQFSLDGGPFSKTNVYPVKMGKHVIQAMDPRGCGMNSLTFHVVSYMKFFSPNNDGYNDKWKIIGIGQGQGQNEPSAPQHIYIFNRYGKLLKEMKPTEGWDGTFHGEPLYEDDYWFKIVYNDGSTFTGHFSLLR